MSLGIVYVAIGKKSIEEACQAAASLKEKNPRLSTTIFSSKELESPYFDRIEIVTEKQYSTTHKIIYISKSPYERTLFLDTDTHVCDDISELFVLLDRFDIALAHAPMRLPKNIASNLENSLKKVSVSFCQMNTGVVLYKKTSKTEHLFKKWLELQIQNIQQSEDSLKQANDQASFREALYNSDVRLATLTPEYNCRLPIGGYLQGKVKILHGRHPDLPAIARTLNSTTEHRVHWLEGNELKVVNLHQALLSTHKKGVRDRLVSVARKIFGSAVN